MNVILFGATGMIGQAVLLECLDDPGVTEVLAVSRRPLERGHPKLRTLLVDDFGDYSAVESQMDGFDACFYCLGIASGGLNEAQYKKITHDYTLAAATTLLRLNPDICFCFVSGQGTDSSERGRLMWARVKGATENALLKMGFKQAYMLRPGWIQPMRGVESRTAAYRRAYQVTGWLYPAIKGFSSMVIASDQLGRVMLRLAREGAPRQILESRDLNDLVP